MKTFSRTVAWVSLVAGALSTRSAFATTTGFQLLAVPSYFNSSMSSPDGFYSFGEMTDFNNVESGPSAVGISIVNAGCDAAGSCDCDPMTNIGCGGPYIQNPNYDPNNPNSQQFIIDQNLQQWITELSQWYGIGVYGYVEFNSGRIWSDIQNDINAWAGYQNLQGIFFDDADRAPFVTSNLAKEEWATDYVAGVAAFKFYGVPGHVIFNWGETSAPEEYFVNCIGDRTAPWPNLFVTQEHDATVYLDAAQVPSGTSGSDYQWLQRYRPEHFIHLIHSLTAYSGGVTQTVVGQIMAKAAALNAGYVYVTDRLDPDKYPYQPDPAGNDPSTGMPFDSRAWNPLAGYNQNQYQNVWQWEAAVATNSNYNYVTYPGAQQDVAQGSSSWGPCPTSAPVE